MSETRPKRLGRGRTAEIYEWGDGKVLKLYVAGSARAYVQREASVSRIVHQAGLPAPAVHDAPSEDGLVETEGRLGIVYDRVDGSTMMHDLGRHPWRIAAHAVTLARIHAQIHATSGEGLPCLRDRLERSLSWAAGVIPEPIRQAAKEQLARLPDASQTCHGDFHPDNIVLTDRGPIVIDWGPATAGHPAADVAWSILLFRYAGMPPGTPGAARAALTLFRRWMLHVYLRTYARATGMGMAQIEPWLVPVAILRLSDDIPGERETLLRFLRRATS